MALIQNLYSGKKTITSNFGISAASFFFADGKDLRRELNQMNEHLFFFLVKVADLIWENKWKRVT